MDIMSVAYSKVTSIPKCLANPFPATMTSTLWGPTGPTCTAQATVFAVHEITSQLMPPIMTVLLVGSESNPDPDITIVVSSAKDPVKYINEYVQGRRHSITVL